MGGSRKYVFVTGGVLSGLGKGLVSASVSKLLQEKGKTVVPVKCDGYLNVDPGTMNPEEHGEVYVLEDGTEVDMDFGHYERFLGVEASEKWNLTSGKVFQKVIEKERKGDYLGETVQMVPHLTDEIKEWFRSVGRDEDADILVVEIGGTVGDMENQFYLEAVRQIISERNDDETVLIHTTLVPYLETTGEQKTKPTQHSVKELRSMGLEPDLLVGRSSEELEKKTTEKISLFCDVEESKVISDPNLETVYELPVVFKRQGVGREVADELGIHGNGSEIEEWRSRVSNLTSGKEIASVAICGKYMDMDDSYASVEEALRLAGAEEGGKVNIEHFSTENLEKHDLEEFDGVVVPGGFGSRGIEGKVKVIEYCRNQEKPLLGLCLGMQLMVIEFGRNVLGIEATSEEFEDQGVNMVVEMPDQKDKNELGGTMRLGSYEANISGTVKKIYGSDTVEERHRHRYEVNPDYVEEFEDEGLKVVGREVESGLAEYVELDEHPFYVGTQAHPEFNTSFENPNPLFLEFVRASSDERL